MTETTDMHRYWIRLDARSSIPVGFRLGCGVTAHSEAEALSLLRDIYPGEPDKFVVTEIVQDVAISDLEPRHVLPNIGDTSRLGIWFPHFSGTAQKSE
jgi:hypothetical protein